MSQIAINTLFEELFARVLSSYRGGLGSIPDQDMLVWGPLVEFRDELGQVWFRMEMTLVFI